MPLKPDAHDLIGTALATFQAEIVPALPAEQRYTALMIAGALASAQRELAVSADTLPPAAHTLYPGEPPSTAEAFERRLAANIEGGDFDAPGIRRAQAFEAIKAINAARLAITNPRRLTAS